MKICAIFWVFIPFKNNEIQINLVFLIYEWKILSQTRVIFPHVSLVRHDQGATSGTEGPGEVYEDLSGDPFEKDNNGRRQRPRSPRTILLQTERTNILVPPERDFTGNKTMPPLPTNVEGCGKPKECKYHRQY